MREQRDKLLVENRKLRADLKHFEDRAKTAEEKLNQLQQSRRRKNKSTTAADGSK